MPPTFRESSSPGRRPPRATRSAGAVVFLFVTLAGPAGSRRAAAAEDVPPDDVLEASGAVIGRITLVHGDIFDTSRPDEDRAVFRMVNRLHVGTRDRTILDLLLFAPGEPYSAAVLAESERIVRAQKYVYDADIRPVRYADGVVDVRVETRDVWTLKPSLGFGRAGGANKTHVGIEEDNLFGFGKKLAFERSASVDRTRSDVQYRDPNVLGSRVVLDLQYGANSDGDRRAVFLERPFFSLDSHWEAGVSALSERRIDALYSQGHVRDRFVRERDGLEVRAGGSHGRSARGVRRWIAGFTYDRNVFAPDPDATAPTAPPPDRTLAYPWVELQGVHDGYLEVRDLDKIARTEDLDLGRRVRIRLGYSAPAFGADRSRALVEFGYADGTNPRDGRFLIGSVHASTRLGGPAGVENARVGAEIRFLARDWGRHLLSVSLRSEAVRAPDPDTQLVLGGEEGLRGYPLRYLEGDRSLLLTVEQRFYTDWHPLRLFRVGAAAFADVGATWGRDGDVPGADGIRRDVGMGLRIGSSRSSTASMVHFDVAFPLDRDPSIAPVQFLVTTAATF